MKKGGSSLAGTEIGASGRATSDASNSLTEGVDGVPFEEKTGCHREKAPIAVSATEASDARSVGEGSTAYLINSTIASPSSVHIALPPMSRARK